jgi:hypothetical protein
MYPGNGPGRLRRNHRRAQSACVQLHLPLCTYLLLLSTAAEENRNVLRMPRLRMLAVQMI